MEKYMARPKPHILLENIDKITYNTDQILASDEIGRAHV